MLLYLLNSCTAIRFEIQQTFARSFDDHFMAPFKVVDPNPKIVPVVFTLFQLNRIRPEYLPCADAPIVNTVANATNDNLIVFH